MAQLKIRPESLIQRINEIVEQVKQWEQLPNTVLLAKPSAKEWNVLEIIEHMIMAYRVYQKQVDGVLAKLPEATQPQETYSPRSFPKLFISMLRPKEEKISWKMKTMPIFEPEEALKGESADIDKIFTEFYAIHQHMKQSISAMRNKEVKKGKVVSGIGPIVKFYLPEAFEFILSHEERHMVQAQKILKAVFDVASV